MLFLGIANQLAKFSPWLTDLSASLHDILRTNMQWTWYMPHEQAFVNTKTVLRTAPVLTLYDPIKPTLVAADANSFGQGSILS